MTEAAEEAVEVIVAFVVETLVPSSVEVKFLHLAWRNNLPEAIEEVWGLRMRLVVAGR